MKIVWCSRVSTAIPATKRIVVHQVIVLPSSSQPASVLVVEPIYHRRARVRAMLENAGFTTAGAPSIDVARAKVRALRVSAVALSASLPHQERANFVAELPPETRAVTIPGVLPAIVDEVESTLQPQIAASPAATNPAA